MKATGTRDVGVIREICTAVDDGSRLDAVRARWQRADFCPKTFRAVVFDRILGGLASHLLWLTVIFFLTSLQKDLIYESHCDLADCRFTFRENQPNEERNQEGC